MIGPWQIVLCGIIILMIFISYIIRRTNHRDEG